MSVKYFIQIHLWKLLVRRCIFETSTSSNRYLMRLITYYCFFFLFSGRPLRYFFIIYNHRSWQRFLLLKIIFAFDDVKQSNNQFQLLTFKINQHILQLNYISIYLILIAGGVVKIFNSNFSIFLYHWSILFCYHILIRHRNVGAGLFTFHILIDRYNLLKLITLNNVMC